MTRKGDIANGRRAKNAEVKDLERHFLRGAVETYGLSVAFWGGGFFAILAFGIAGNWYGVD